MPHPPPRPPTPEEAAAIGSRGAPPGQGGHFSGIVVTADPARIDAVAAALAALPGIEVGDRDAHTGRIVVVQEAADVGAEVAAFSRIRMLPGVLAADLVCHYFGDAGAAAPPPGA